MTHTRLPPVLVRLARPAAFAAVACAALLGTAISTPAAAWWRGGGVFIGIPPIVVAPPIYSPGYYPPPAYYPPPYYAPPSPPAAYAPSAPAQQSAGQSCYAGPYVCPMDHPVVSGSGCYCLGNDRTQVWGRAS
jgi:hypothetical protein